MSVIPVCFAAMTSFLRRISMIVDCTEAQISSMFSVMKLGFFCTSFCKKYNIDVSFIDMDKPYAFNQYNPLSQRYTIYISNAVDRYSSKILCAHELGHIFCEKPQAVSLFDHEIDPVSEFIANSFASLIVPFDARFKLEDDTTIEDYNNFVTSLILKKNY
jgi:Zn-dependent peptidase ImmA (M78 family)